MKIFQVAHESSNAASENISTHCTQCISGSICQRTQTANKQRTLIYNRISICLNCVWTDDFMLKCQQARKGNLKIRNLETDGQNLVENKSFLVPL